MCPSFWLIDFIFTSREVKNESGCGTFTAFKKQSSVVNLDIYAQWDYRHNTICHRPFNSL